MKKVCDRRDPVHAAQARFFGGYGQTGVVLGEQAGGVLGSHRRYWASSPWGGGGLRQQMSAGDNQSEREDTSQGPSPLRGDAPCREQWLPQEGVSIPGSSQEEGGQPLGGHAEGRIDPPRTHGLRRPWAEPPTHVGPGKGVPGQATSKVAAVRPCSRVPEDGGAPAQLPPKPRLLPGSHQFFRSLHL